MTTTEAALREALEQHIAADDLYFAEIDGESVENKRMRIARAIGMRIAANEAARSALSQPSPASSTAEEGRDLRADMADALDCFWNAAIGAAHNAQDSTAFATIGCMTEGFAAVANRLREHAALSPSGEPASDACTVCGIANRNHHTHLAPFNENFHPFGEPASVAGEAVAIIAAFRDKFSADWLDRLFGPDMKRRMDAALSKPTPVEAGLREAQFVATEPRMSEGDEDEDGNPVWCVEIQTIGGWSVVATVWGGSPREASARGQAILAALSETPPPPSQEGGDGHD